MKDSKSVQAYLDLWSSHFSGLILGMMKKKDKVYNYMSFLKEVGALFFFVISRTQVQ